MGAIKQNEWTFDFKKLTDNGQYKEAKELLQKVQPKDPSEERTLGHFQSQVYFYEGESQKALDHARSIETSFGPNIRLRGDIVVYLYYLDAGPRYLEALAQFKDDFFNVREKLSNESLFWTSLNLAKLLEEQGDIATSIQLYIDLLKNELDSERELRTKANLLRCYAILGGKEKITKLYGEVFFSKADKLSRFAKFEQEHSLLLADLHVLGHKGAENRLKQLLSNPEFDSYEKSLSYYDFLDVLLLTNMDACKAGSVPSELIPAPQFFFEKEISLIFGGIKQGSSLPLPDLYHLKASRSPIDVLRILSHSARSTDAEVAAFCRMQLALLLENVPAASQKFWQGRLPQAQHEDLCLNLSEKRLQFKSRSIDLKRSAKQIQLLQLFSQQQSWSCPDLCTELYGFWDATSSFDRLRMLVRSLNENVRSLTGDNLLNLDEKSASLRSQFNLPKIV